MSSRICPDLNLDADIARVCGLWMRFNAFLGDPETTMTVACGVPTWSVTADA